MTRSEEIQAQQLAGQGFGVYQRHGADYTPTGNARADAQLSRFASERAVRERFEVDPTGAQTSEVVLQAAFKLIRQSRDAARATTARPADPSQIPGFSFRTGSDDPGRFVYRVEVTVEGLPLPSGRGTMPGWSRAEYVISDGPLTAQQVRDSAAVSAREHLRKVIEESDFKRRLGGVDDALGRATFTIVGVSQR